jgi:large subunit ribosomal protein L32e
MTKEEIIKEFSELKGIGKVKAELLYKNGFDSIDKLKNSTVKDLTKIKGISEKNANDILVQFKDITSKKVDKEKEKIETKKVEKEEEKKAEEEVEIVEEKEEYKVKQKPSLDKNEKRKLTIRKQIKSRTPDFLREEWFRYKKIPKNWRRPDGITSKMRINLKYRPSLVRVGFRGPKGVRGFHPSGFKEVLVYNVKDLNNIDPKKQAVRIGGTVGTKKRLEIAKKAEELKIRILNIQV